MLKVSLVYAGKPAVAMGTYPRAPNSPIEVPLVDSWDQSRYCLWCWIPSVSGGKIQIEHREMRAKAMSHLSKHKVAYAAHWDREGPNGKPLDSFDTYLQESAKDSAYASPLEIEARARIFDVRVLVIPCLADFEVIAFRASQEKRVLVLALWYEDKHVSLLLPKEGKKYPDSALQISTGPGASH